jgi:hypothetical protein
LLPESAPWGGVGDGGAVSTFLLYPKRGVLKPNFLKLRGKFGKRLCDNNSAQNFYWNQDAIS